MATLTVSRDIGSGGMELAHLVASKTGLRIADKAVLENIMLEYGFSDFEKRYDGTVSFWGFAEEFTAKAVDFLDRVLLAIAAEGNVIIVGRGGYVPLSGLSDVMNLRITAPFPVRVTRIAADRGMTDQAEAERVVSSMDRTRRAFVARYYGVKWEDLSRFALVADTSVVPVQALADVVVASLSAYDARGSAGRRAGDHSVDPLLADVVRKHLSESRT